MLSWRSRNTFAREFNAFKMKAQTVRIAGDFQ
ncbi:hypothetical protein ANAPRD1_00691 [Anaplasma phagocytophilum]|nr:hypothetical protein ANAPC3_01223 [Anaplasma phagocytophilum]SCV64753.1 hypothetical protein ANAPRD1_00691 [Anaplasma phagocytophilum]